jgi:hypothetical protein
LEKIHGFREYDMSPCNQGSSGEENHLAAYFQGNEKQTYNLKPARVHFRTIERDEAMPPGVTGQQA